MKKTFIFFIAALMLAILPAQAQPAQNWAEKPATASWRQKPNVQEPKKEKEFFLQQQNEVAQTGKSSQIVKQSSDGEPYFMDLDYSQTIPANGTTITGTVSADGDKFVGPEDQIVTGKPFHFYAKTGGEYEITVTFNTEGGFYSYAGVYVLKPEESWVAGEYNLVRDIYRLGYGQKQVTVSGTFWAFEEGVVPVIVYDGSQNDYDFSITIEEKGVYDLYTTIDYTPIVDNQASGSVAASDMIIVDGTGTGKGFSFPTQKDKMYAVTVDFEWTQPVEEFYAWIFIFNGGALTGDDENDFLTDNGNYGAYETETTATVFVVSPDGGNLRILLFHWAVPDNIGYNYTINIVEMDVPRSYTALDYPVIAVDGAQANGSLALIEFDDELITGNGYSFNAREGYTYRISIKYEAAQDVSFNSGFHILKEKSELQGDVDGDMVNSGAGVWFYGSETTVTGNFTPDHDGTFSLLLVDHRMNDLNYTVSVKEIEIKHYTELDYNPIPVNEDALSGMFEDVFIDPSWSDDPMSGAGFSFDVLEGQPYRIIASVEGQQYYDTHIMLYDEEINFLTGADFSLGTGNSGERSVGYISEYTGKMNVILRDVYMNDLQYTIRVESPNRFYTELDYEDTVPIGSAGAEGSFNSTDNRFAVGTVFYTGKDLIFTAEEGKMYDIACTLKVTDVERIGGELIVLTGNELTGNVNDDMIQWRSTGTGDGKEVTFTLRFIPAQAGDYRLLLLGYGGAPVFNYNVSIEENAPPTLYSELTYAPLTSGTSVSGSLNESNDIITSPDYLPATGKGYSFNTEAGKIYLINGEFNSDGEYSDWRLGYYLFSGDNSIITEQSYLWYDDDNVTFTFFYAAETSGEIRILLFDESLRDVEYTLTVRNVLTLPELLAKAKTIAEITPETPWFTDRGFTEDLVGGADGNYMYTGDAYYAAACKITLEEGIWLGLRSKVDIFYNSTMSVYAYESGNYQRLEMYWSDGANGVVLEQYFSAGEYYLVINSEYPDLAARYSLSIWIGDDEPGNGFDEPAIDIQVVESDDSSYEKGGVAYFSAYFYDTYGNYIGEGGSDIEWSVEGGVAGTVISDFALLSIAANETATQLVVKATSKEDPATFGQRIITLQEYSIIATELMPFGALTVGYAQPEEQWVTLTNATVPGANMGLYQPTAEFFEISSLYSYLYNDESEWFTVRPKAGLPVGVYEETITINTSTSASATVTAHFIVSEEPTYIIRATPTVSFGTLEIGYTVAALSAIPVYITNTGSESVTLTQPVPVNYMFSMLEVTTLAQGESTYILVRPREGLGVGTHEETITIEGSNGATATVNVSFTVIEYTYNIVASPLASFGSRQASYIRPAAQTVTITNTGTGVIWFDEFEAEYYDIGSFSSESIPVGETATFTVRPKAGLPIGEYVETITIFCNNGRATATITASFEVTAPLTYSIGATTIASFGVEQAPYTQPAAQTVTVTNTGTAAVTLTQPTAIDYEIGALSTTNLDVYGTTATFTVRPKAGLSAGTYNETIIVGGSDGVSATVVVSFSVIAAPIYTIEATPETMDFGALIMPYERPDAQTVTIRNTGTASVTLTQPTAANYDIGTLSPLTLANDADAFFTVRPKAELPVGTYNETITISGTNGVSATVEVSFSVSIEPVYAISASALTSFGSMQENYATSPAAQTVTVTNTGTESLALTQPTATGYVIGMLSRIDLIAGQTATFTVRPKTGLEAGSHNETITINATSGANSASATVNAVFSVTAAPTFTISASSLTSFGSMETPYTQPAAQTVTITNTGTGTVALTQPAATNYDIGALSTTTIAANATATFTVRPKAGLATGTYNETITVSGSNGANATVSASFEVKTATTSSGEDLSANPLRAWMRNGLLHVTGLTVGETISIYSVTGALAYHSNVANEEIDIQLPAQGVYIVSSGNNTVRVFFH